MPKVPGPGSLLTLGALVRQRGNMPALLTALKEKHGDIARARIGNSSFYLLSHPDHIMEVLETKQERFERVMGERRVSRRIAGDSLFWTEGEAHLGQRRVMEPVMYEQIPADHVGSVIEVGSALLSRISEGRTLDLFEWLEQATDLVLVRVVFGLAPDDPRAEDMTDALERAVGAMDSLPAAFSSLPERVPRTSARFKERLSELNELIYDVVTQRKREGAAGTDVVSKLLSAGMTDLAVRDATVALYRGHQAVSTSLAWTYNYLSELPDIEAKLLAEVDEVIGPRTPEPSDLPRLEFTRKVFAESLRLSPPAYVLARRVVADHEVDGYVIPTGAQLLVSAWVTQRDARWWPEPERFDPERFTLEAQASRPSYAYFPQGGGPKMCMGKHFVAPIEGPLLLAMLSSRWRFRRDPSRKVEMSAKATLKPKSGIWMIPQKRT